MPFAPASKQAPETPSIPAVATPWLDTIPQQAAPSQAKKGVQEGAQSQSNDRAQILQFLSGYRPSFFIRDYSRTDLEIMLNVFQTREACDIIFVCHLMSPFGGGEFERDDIARVIKARDDCKYDEYDHFQVGMIATLMGCAGSDDLGGEVKEGFGAQSQWKRWLKVKERYILRGRKRDESDEEEKSAWEIWTEAKAELEKLEELDEMSVEAS